MRVPRPIFLLARVLLHALTASLIFLLRIMPERWGYGIGRALTLLTWRMAARWRRTCDTNLRIFYKDEPLGADTPEAARQREVIGRAAAVNLGYVAIEFMRSTYLPLDRALDEMIVESEGEEHMRAAGALGRGVCAIGMHYGNWEIAGSYLNRRVHPLTAVGKEQRDDFFTRLAFDNRARYGIKNIFSGNKVNSAILKALKNNEALGLLTDQNGGRAGRFAPFAGTLASTAQGAAALHLRYGAPLIIVTAIRLRPGRLRFFCSAPVDTTGIAGHDPETGRYTDEALIECITRINAAYETVIRRDPTQWMWGHKRWKTRPPGEPSLYD